MSYNFSVIDIIYKINQKIHTISEFHTSEMRINFKLSVMILIWELFYSRVRGKSTINGYEKARKMNYRSEAPIANSNCNIIVIYSKTGSDSMSDRCT